MEFWFINGVDNVN